MKSLTSPLIALVAVATTAVAAPLAAPAASAAAPGTSVAAAIVPADLVRTVTYGGKTMTVRLRPVTIRSSLFEVLVQQADGSLVKQTDVAPENAWLGTVDGDSSATVVGIVQHDGTFRGLIAFDRGGTWDFQDTAAGSTSTKINSTRGLGAPSLHWPSSTDANRNATVTPGQTQGKTYEFTVAYDLANNYFVSEGSSVANALDEVQFEVATMYPLYVSNAMIRPALGRVIVRADAAKDPYAVNSDLLSKVTTEWKTNQVSAAADDVVLRHNYGGGGVAWVGTAGGTSGTAVVGGAGAGYVVQRHEVGHNWAAHDNHTNGPEGSTVNSGNQYHRWDGTEVRSILNHRNNNASKFIAAGNETASLPPYAALDLTDDLPATKLLWLKPTANDFDANGDALSLTAVDATSSLGGTVTRSGDWVTYTPPAVTADNTFDSFRYTVTDATGRTATGVAMFRVDPYTAPDSTTWPASTSFYAGFDYQFVNASTDQAIRPRATSGVTSTPAVQNDKTVVPANRFVLTPFGSGYRIKNPASNLCLTANGTPSKPTNVPIKTCATSTRTTSQQWKVLQHPTGGVVLKNVGTGKCLVPSAPTAGATIIQATCDLGRRQSWSMPQVGPEVAAWADAAAPDTAASYKLKNAAAGLYASVTGDPAAWESAPVVDVDNGLRTQFQFKAVTVGFNIKTRTSAGQCVEDNWGDGNDLDMWYCGNSAEVGWRLKTRPNGGTALVNVNSGKCLATKAGDTAAGTVLWQDDCSGALNQRWNLEKVAAP